MWPSPSPLSEEPITDSGNLPLPEGGGIEPPTARAVPGFKTGRRPFSGTLQVGARKHPSEAVRSTGP